MAIIPEGRLPSSHPSAKLPSYPGRGPFGPGGQYPGQPGGGQGGPSPSDPKTKLDAANAKLKSQQAKIKILQMQEAHIRRPNPKDKKAVAKYKAQKAVYEKQIKALQTANKKLQAQIPDLQNKYWESTGQYDKLLTGSNRDAFMALNSLFKSYGLGSLADKIYKYVKNGESADTISILLQDTPEYKKRFAGNEARKAAGLAVLSPAEYLATEASYQQIMSSAGLPVGFYDKPDDFANWIGKNISPSEIQNRVDLATQATVLASPEYRAALNKMGIDNAHLTAYFLDADKALPYIQKAAATAQIGAEALRNNLQFDQAYAEQLATMGISGDQARQGYAQVAGELDTMNALGTIYGEGWNEKQSEAAAFGTAGATEARAKQGRLLSRERGAFGGAVGGARAGLGGTGGQR